MNSFLQKSVNKTINHPIVKNRLRPLYHAFDDFFMGDILSPNKELKNKYQGERCFIICTGASLNEIEIHRLIDEFTFGTGQLHSPELDYNIRRGFNRLSYAYKELKDISLSFYTALDPVRNVLSPRDRVQYHLDFWRSANATFNNTETIFFVNGADKRFFEKHKLLTGRKVHYVKTLMPMEQAHVQSNDLSKRTTFFDGSIFFIIAASIYMGFKELYLCGCGYTYQPIYHFHFYDEPEFSIEMPVGERNRLIHELLKARGLSIQKIRQDGDYYRPVYIRYKPVDRRHEIMIDFAKQHGVNIYNIVPDGFESPIYEKVSWDFVEKNVLGNNSDASVKVRNEGVSETIT